MSCGREVTGGRLPYLSCRFMSLLFSDQRVYRCLLTASSPPFTPAKCHVHNMPQQVTEPQIDSRRRRKLSCRKHLSSLS